MSINQNPDCNNCNEEEDYSPKCCQYDASQVIYRLNSNALSSLSYLGIGRGDSLEFIIEKLGKHILESNPNFVESFGFENKDLKSIITDLYDKICYLENQLETKNTTIEDVHNRTVELRKELNELKNPGLLDSKGIGFTKHSDLTEVIQKIIDYGL